VFDDLKLIKGTDERLRSLLRVPIFKQTPQRITSMKTFSNISCVRCVSVLLLQLYYQCLSHQLFRCLGKRLSEPTSQLNFTSCSTKALTVAHLHCRLFLFSTSNTSVSALETAPWKGTQT
jgi:hypothetical protein